MRLISFIVALVLLAHVAVAWTNSTEPCSPWSWRWPSSCGSACAAGSHSKQKSARDLSLGAGLLDGRLFLRRGASPSWRRGACASAPCRRRWAPCSPRSWRWPSSCGSVKAFFFFLAVLAWHASAGLVLLKFNYKSMFSPAIIFTTINVRFSRLLPSIKRALPSYFQH